VKTKLFLDAAARAIRDDPNFPEGAQFLIALRDSEGVGWAVYEGFTEPDEELGFLFSHLNAMVERSGGTLSVFLGPEANQG